jgi:hypothetical protein
MSKVDTGDAVKVHYNLHRCPVGRDPGPGEACWVIRKGSTVAGYAPAVLLRDAEFTVQPGGLQRIRQKKSREVIAYAKGTIASPTAAPRSGWVPVCFNPYRNETFVHCKTGKPIRRARYAQFVGRSASAEGALGRTRRRR